MRKGPLGIGLGFRLGLLGLVLASNGRAEGFSGLPELEWTVNQTGSVQMPLTPALNEAEFSCDPGPTVPEPPAPLARVRIPRKLRLWASAGPGPELRDRTPRWRLSLRASQAGVPGALLACGPEISVDLEPGDYFVYGASRTSQFSDSDRWEGRDGFVYRVSEVGDSYCPQELATHGIYDWDGEFPYSVDSPGDINGDGQSDVAVHYQYAYTNPGTRLLVREPYPRCYRTVLDTSAGIQVQQTRSGQWRTLVSGYWNLHPSPYFGGRMNVYYAARYQPQSQRYEDSLFLGCREGFPGENAVETAESEAACNAELRHRVAKPLDWIADWLSAAPAERKPWPNSAPTGVAELMTDIDVRGFRWDFGASANCEPTAGMSRAVREIKIYAPGDPRNRWSRTTFFVASQRQGQGWISTLQAHSPCPVAEEASGIESLVSDWIASPWAEALQGLRSKAAITAREHRQLQRAAQDNRLEFSSVNGCATNPESPAWLWVAGIDPQPTEHSGRPRPIYVLVRRIGQKLAIERVMGQRPLFCQNE